MQIFLQTGQILLWCAILLVPLLSYGKEKIRVVPPASPPIISFDNQLNRASGFLYDLWKKEIDGSNDFSTTWVETIPADRIILQMNEKKIDMGISAKNLSRFPEDLVEYSPSPIYEAPQLIVGRIQWPEGQEKTVLVSTDTLVPSELTSDPRYKIVKIYGLDQTTRIVELLEQKRAWGYYSPVHWVATLELLKRNQLSNFSPYYLEGRPKRKFYVFASKKLTSATRIKFFRALSAIDFQHHIDRSLKESCSQINKKTCTDFLKKLK